MIERSVIEDMFARAKGYRWSIEAPCVWSFFFAGRDRAALLAAGHALADTGYEFVGLLEPTPDDDDQELLFAQLSRVERHTVDSLDMLNRELSTFAARFDGVVYDGMDVGPADGVA